ncbi:MmgE/PrpD family protein [Shouchella sp. 1P09AA]|uniref:MmgE/PrpD family protein n=1 Tax=unclassified Shouchella TaxID=2893065 RepID=UPI0039A31A21
MSETRTLTNFCYEITYQDLPSEVLLMTKKLLIDCIGVTLKGMQEPASLSMLTTAQALATTGSSTVIGKRESLPSQYAALVNGTAAHSIELDDVTSESSLHPGVVMVPTALAIAEEFNSSPEEFLAAMVAGYEMMMRVGDALTNPSGNYDSGFHPTGICGVFGATITAGKLMKLTKEELLHAVGIAGSMASGSMEYVTDGAWTKKFHAGCSAHNGIIAAKMAQSGFEGPTTIFEGTFGFFQAYASVYYPEKLTEDFASPYKIMQTNIKLHACCRYMHAQMDAALHIRESHSVEINDIRRIDVTVLTAGEALVASPIEKKRAPQNRVDAQFSLPYGIAAALVFGHTGYNQFEKQHTQRLDIQSLMQKIHVTVDPELDQRYPTNWPAKLQITLADDTSFAQDIEHPVGGWPSSLPTNEQITTKFTELTSDLYAEETINQFTSDALQFEQLTSIQQLLTHLRTSQSVY